MDSKRRALVLSTERSRGTLSAVRSLQRSGWFVGVGTPTASGMLSSARACSAAHAVPKPRGHGDDFVAAVNEAVDAGGYDVVFGSADDWMAALSAYRHRIDAIVAHPDFPVVEAALDKLHLAQLGREAGVATPHTELAEYADANAWRGPVVVTCRSHWTPGRVEDHRIEAKLVTDITRARPQIEFIRTAGEQAVLQEPVTGRLSALIGVFHDGRLDARVQQVTSGLWPTPNGVSTRARTVPVDEALVARCERLLGRLGWQGLVELQFLTGDDGVPQLIDLNGRFFGSMALTNAARPGVPDLWGRLVLDETTEPLPDAPSGHRYSWLSGDLRRAMVERRGSLAQDVAETVRWSHAATDSVWDRRDPGPTLRLIKERLTPGARPVGARPERARAGSSPSPGRAE